MATANDRAGRTGSRPIRAPPAIDRARRARTGYTRRAGLAIARPMPSPARRYLAPSTAGEAGPPRGPARATSPRTTSEGAMSAEADGPGGLPVLVAPSGPWAPFVGRGHELGALRAALA